MAKGKTEKKTPSTQTKKPKKNEALSPSGKALSQRAPQKKVQKRAAAPQRATKKSSAARYPKKEITAIVMIFVSIMFVLSYYFKSFGIVGELVKNLGCILLGASSYVIPVILCIATVHLFAKGTLAPHVHRYVFASLMLIFVSGLHTLYFTTLEPELFSSGNAAFASLIETAVTSGKDCHSGGIVGAILALPLRGLVSSTGAAVILVCLSLLCIVTATGLEPLTNFAAFISDSVSSLIDRMYEEKESAAEEAEKERIDRNSEAAGSKSGEKAAEKKKKRKDIPSDAKEPEKTDNKPAETETKSEDDAEQADSDFEIHVFEPKPTDELPNLSEPVKKAEIPKDIEEMAIDVSGGVKEVKEDNSPIELTDSDIDTDHIDYEFPPVDLLSRDKLPAARGDKKEDLRTQANKLIETLKSFGVEAKVLEVSKGPSVTRFEIQPSAGVKVSKIVNLADDIALNLAAMGVRIEAPIPGKAAVGIEIPNKNTSMVRLRDVIDTDEFRNYKSKTAFAMGKNIEGVPVVSDISKMPHMLIAGATGSGKSVCINSLITSILYKADPNQVKLILIDPKVVELGVYNGIPHLLIPVVTDPRRAAGALNWAVQEMVKRYRMFADTNVRDIKGYNEYAAINGEREMEQIIIIIDELADLMMVSPRDVEDSICRLAQMARAAGMHLVIATQRPSVDVITGLIKANVPSRIAFSVSSQIDSRTILDMGGAEKLLGKGDMLFLPMGASKPTRIQGAFVSDKEVENIVNFVKTDFSAKYDEDVMEHIENGVEDNSEAEDKSSDWDELLPQAIEIVVDIGQASASLLQRKLKVGYSRAGRLVDQLEERGIIGPHEGSKPRRVLMTKTELMELNASGNNI